MEKWKPIVGWEGLYDVSSLGRIRSLVAKYGPRSQPLMMALQDRGVHYWSVVLKSGGQKWAMTYVHRVVAAAFIGPSPAGYECDHIDGNGFRNVPSNLEWISPEENRRRQSVNGGRACGPTSGVYVTGKGATATVEQIRRYEDVTRRREATRKLYKEEGIFLG